MHGLLFFRNSSVSSLRLAGVAVSTVDDEAAAIMMTSVNYRITHLPLMLSLRRADDHSAAARSGVSSCERPGSLRH
jgi:hypothetical protein